MKEAKKVKGIFEKAPGSGVWWVRYADASGQIRREVAGSKSAAIKLYQKRKTEIREGKKLPDNLRARKITFAELAADTLEYSKTHKRSYSGDKARMKRLEEWIGHRPAESLSPQEIERWLADKPELQPATLNRYRSLISLAYRLGIQNGKVHGNPARLVRQRREDNGRVRFLTSDEEQLLRSVIKRDYPHREAELDVALNTGLRRSEQYRLTWDCVNFERRLLTIPCTKNGETRHVPLNDAAIAALRAVQRYKDGSQFVFLNTTGLPSKSPRFWFDAAVESTQIREFTWHCLRHTFASRLVMAGVDLRTVQELMGHRTIQMTVRYAHLAPKHRLDAVQKLCDTGIVQNRPTDTRTDTSPEQYRGPIPDEEGQVVAVQ